MSEINFTFISGDETEIYVHKHIPKEKTKIRGVVQIAHGMAETAARYVRFANFLNENGYVVYINDHRGHGETAKVVEKIGYLGDEEGFNWLVEDTHQLSGIIKKEYPTVPLFLFGHSMGSFIVQKYIMHYGEYVKGVILSGSNGKQGIKLELGLLNAINEIKKNGRKAKSEKLNNMFFGSYNNDFKPARTDFDWLSRDEKEVDKYINDPFCGTTFTAGFYYDFISGLKSIENKDNIKRIPKELPIYIFSGDKDPVGNNGKGVIKLYNTYRKNKINNVTYKLYSEGRHEMLNEINRDEVMKDVLNWLDKH